MMTGISGLNRSMAADVIDFPQSASQSQSTSNKQEVSKEAFMQLLVAQIKNQNPLNPADGVEFLTQLAQFSQLEQLVNIKSEISGLRETLATPEVEPEETGATA